MMEHNSLRWLARTLSVELHILQRVAADVEDTPERCYRHKLRQTAPNKTREIDEPVGNLRSIQERIKRRLLGTC